MVSITLEHKDKVNVLSRNTTFKRELDLKMLNKGSLKLNI